MLQLVLGRFGWFCWFCRWFWLVLLVVLGRFGWFRVLVATATWSESMRDETVVHGENLRIPNKHLELRSFGLIH